MSRAVDVSGRGVRVEGRGVGVGVGTAIPDSDEFQDGSLNSMWTWLSEPTSYSESGDVLSVDFSNHQGDNLPASGAWELLYQEGDLETFDIGIKFSANYDATNDIAVGVGLEDASGTRRSTQYRDEGTNYYFLLKTPSGSVGNSRDNNAASAASIWLRLQYDGSDLSSYYDYGSSFSSWTFVASETISLSNPLKIGLEGNIISSDFDWFRDGPP